MLCTNWIEIIHFSSVFEHQLFCSVCFACLCKVLLLCMSLLISFGSVVDHLAMYILIVFIIHQTHYEKSDWSRAFNQFTIACELDMINVISAADITFIMSSSTSAWLLSPLECSPQKQNGWTLRFCFWGWIMWKMYNKTIIEFGFRMISWIIKTSCLCYLPQPSASADNTDLGFDNSWYHAQPHPIIVYYPAFVTLWF